MNSIPDLIDNRKHILAQALRSLLASHRNLQGEETIPRLDVVTAFFNLGGLEEIKPEIANVAKLRLLLGKEQEQSFLVGEHLLSELEKATAQGKVSSQEIAHWRAFLASETVEVRYYKEAFVHGKAYIIEGVPTVGSLGIVGSSNFTGAGLTRNLELNAVLKQDAAVDALKEWFENLWAEAEDYKTELLELLERFTRVYTPYEIYIKVIYEALRDRLDQDLEERKGQPSPIALADFQRDGYLAAKEILENYGGVIIADSVGLGKTYLALRLLEDYAYHGRQTALVICPAALRDTVWEPLLRQFAIPGKVHSMEWISQKKVPTEELARNYQIIVVDESHNFRNHQTNRWSNLFEVIRNGLPEKKVILLTATPVNNTVFDLYNQLRLITRDDRGFLRSVGITDLFQYFRQAEQNREALYEVLEAMAVRRSRHFIRTNYPNAQIDGEKIHFPERKLHTARYSLKAIYGPDLYRKIAQTIENLQLAPYQVETYRKDLARARNWAKQLSLFEATQEEDEGTLRRFQEALGWSEKKVREFLFTLGRQTALAHIMRVLYLKRLESSVEALRISLTRLRHFLQTFLKFLDQGRLLSAQDYHQLMQWEDSWDEEGESLDLEAFLTELQPLPSERYDLQEIRQDVQADLQAIEEILGELKRERADDKLEALKKLLTSAELRGKKVVVFSYFKDTARYLYQQLKEDEHFLSALGHRRISIVDSNVKPEERRGRIVRFAPKANDQDLPPEEQIDLLISTDVLSEGQNLQDAQVLINYDLHWNPVRMVQRVGRLDRIGSPHSVIHVYNFFPEEELEELLGLLERLQEKLEAINRTVGLDASVLGEKPNPMDFNILRRLHQEDEETLSELEGIRELTVGEFLKQDLLHFLKKLGEERLKRIPLGMGTARKSPEGKRGFFAAFRNPQTSQHHWLFYDEQKDQIIERRLEAISAIRCTPEEPAEPLPEDFDPRPYIQRLRKHLWNRIRATEVLPSKLPSPQRQAINWLNTQLPSATRNHLLQYLARPLTGADLKAFQRLWRSRKDWPLDKWLTRLSEFAAEHPHPPAASTGESSLAPAAEEELVCIAWMVVGRN
ncbi:MAG: hypothetical protein J7M05_09090 [Anaerolineae bacterium]|nr:hypothetical protein [Anaerolineae bacterium]